MGLIDPQYLDASTSAPAPTGSTQPQDNGQIAYNYFVNNGYAPHQAAGIVGNLQGESGQGLNPNAVNRGDGRDGSDSIGIGQWNGTRAQALKDYAASNNLPVNDINTQLQFLHQELKGSESGANKRLMAAETPEQAGQAMLAYERPKDWNKPGAHPERAQYAAKAYAAYGSQPSAPTSPMPGQPSPVFASAPPTAPSPQPAPQAAAAPPGSPLNIAPPQAPIFAPPQAAPQQQAAPSAPFDPSAFAQVPQAPPIFAPPRRQINLANLRAAFPAPSFRG